MVPRIMAISKIKKVRTHNIKLQEKPFDNLNCSKKAKINKNEEKS